jgi:hypothetical protein
VRLSFVDHGADLSKVAHLCLITFVNHQCLNLDVDQISAINFEYRLAFCVLHAPLEQIAALNYKFEKSTWTTESSKNVGDVLDSLKLGLDNKTTPDSLMHTDIGKSIGHGSTKTAYTLKDHPDLLFLQLYEGLENSYSVGRLKNEVEWINKFRELGVKTPKYFKRFFDHDRPSF